MMRVYFNKKRMLMMIATFSLLLLISNDPSAEEISGGPVAIHLNLKEGVEMSPETSGDLERVAIEERHSSYETSSPFTRNKGDWKNMGTWESDPVIYETSVSNVMFNLWWVEDTSEEDYDAALDLQWTVYVDGNEIYQFTDEDANRECDDTQGASKEEPCEYVATPNNDLSTTLTVGQKISVKAEMKAFQAIYIFYDNFTRDTGMKVLSNGMMFGNTGISGSTVFFEFIQSWDADCNEAVDGNFITILVGGVELDNSQQASGYPKVSEGNKYLLNGTEITSERVTWRIDDEYAKLDQSTISFSYSKKDTSTTSPILLNVADKLVVNSGGAAEDEGLLGLPGFEFTAVISMLLLVGLSRRKV